MKQNRDDEDDRRGRVRRSAEQWAGLLAAQASSGLSIAAFCRARGLSVSGFYGWRRRLGVGGQRHPARRAASSSAQVPDAALPGAGFVRLRVTEDEVSGQALAAGVERDPVMVRFPDGVELHVGGERLGQVLAWLRAGVADAERA